MLTWVEASIYICMMYVMSTSHVVQWMYDIYVETLHRCAADKCGFQQFLQEQLLAPPYIMYILSYHRILLMPKFQDL